MPITKALRFGMASAALLVVPLFSGPVANSTPFCANNRAQCASGSAQVRVMHISAAYAKTMARKILGDAAVAHMIHRYDPAQLHPSTRPAFEYSSNWGGYVSDVSGTSYSVSSVQSYFNVAAVCGSCPILGTWVGIGGYYTGSLIQTGVDQQALQTWYEMLPAAPVYLYSVSNGDQMVGVVSMDYDTGLWYLDIQDFTSSTYYANEFGYGADQTTADWIEEQASYGTVPSVATVSFTNAYWTEVGTPGTPRAINSSLVGIVHQIYMNPGTGGCLVPSGLGSAGESFTVSRTSSC